MPLIVHDADNIVSKPNEKSNRNHFFLVRLALAFIKLTLRCHDGAVSKPATKNNVRRRAQYVVQPELESTMIIIAHYDLRYICFVHVGSLLSQNVDFAPIALSISVHADELLSVIIAK